MQIKWRPPFWAYTHKLNFELDATFAPFAWLPKDRWLHHLEVEALLDYIATGLAEEGDVVDGRRYLEDASGWSASAILEILIAPLNQ